MVMIFSERMKELRTEKGVKQKDVAEFIGISTKGYCFYELGQREPSLQTLSKLCDYFEVSADYLIGRSDSY